MPPYCIGCGQQQMTAMRFCRFCGENQPGQQLLARLHAEADRIRMSGKSPQGNNEATQNTLSTLARLEELRRAADEEAHRRNNTGAPGR